jgi:type II secretory pathway component GspD/PulD (secretin)
MARSAVAALLCCLLASIGIAQDKKSSTPARTQSNIQRSHYVVRNADPAALAEIVGKHLKGEAEVLAAPAGSGNAILISGSRERVNEVVELLEQLDRKARSVEVEIVLANVPVAKEEGGPAPDPTKLDALAKGGTGHRIKLTAVEGQPVTSTTGGDKPIATGTTEGRFGGRELRQVQYRPLGTTVRLTARVQADDAVSLNLNLEDTRVRQADGDAVIAPSFDQSKRTTTLIIPAGKSVVAQAVRTDEKTGGTTLAVIVTARVVPDRDASKSK